jgi:hypothetical protein
MTRDERIGAALNYGDPGYLEPGDVRYLVDRWATLNCIKSLFDSCATTADWVRAYTQVDLALGHLKRLDSERAE